ncbi:MAG: LpxI family protein [Bryobacterales bacterium]|nr:LpxI family protein [Bryobacterales bacterium]
MRYALIAGNGRFPVLALESARQARHEVLVLAIRDEASPEVESLAWRCHWISLGDLSRLIDIVKSEGISEITMAGQVKHASIFSSIRPDWRLFKLLAALPRRNTDALIGAVAKVLSDEGIQLMDSTLLLKGLLAEEGPLTKRMPTPEEQADIVYGRPIANLLSGMDVGQSVVICECACVALEAMEGTDATLRRAAGFANGRPLTLVKASRRRKHLLYDVPVTGPRSIEVMYETGATALAIDAGRTLLLDRERMIQRAEAWGISIVGLPPV